MAKKKSAFDALKEGKFNAEEAAKEAKEGYNKKYPGKEPKVEVKEEVPRKMIRVSPEVHLMAKKAGALSGKHMQSYIEELIHKDFKSKYPELWEQTMEDIKSKYPELYKMVMASSKHW